MNENVITEEVTETDIYFKHQELVPKDLSIGKHAEIAAEQIVTLKAEGLNVQKPADTQRGASLKKQEAC